MEIIKDKSCNCPRCAMPSEFQRMWKKYKEIYEIYFCHECKKSFHIIVSGISLKKLIERDK